MTGTVETAAVEADRSAGGARRRTARRTITAQTWTAFVSAGLFVALAIALAVLPVPFVAWSPGNTFDLNSVQDNRPAVSVVGATTYPTDGRLRMTTVSVTRADGRLSLPEALSAHWMPDRDVLPRELVYPSGKSPDAVHAEEVAMMDSSKQDALVAAMKAARLPVKEMVQIRSVAVEGPAYSKLMPGDLVERVDQAEVDSKDQYESMVRTHIVGEPIVFTVFRDGRSRDVTVSSVASNTDRSIPVIGVEVRMGFKVEPRVNYGIDPEIVGPSAGLMFSLAIYDRLTPSSLTGGRDIAGTGEIDPAGKVGSIGGIQEKIAAAQDDGAEVFLVPADNCPDVRGVRTTMRMVKVTHLADAISSLNTLAQSPDQEVPTC